MMKRTIALFLFVVAVVALGACVAHDAPPPSSSPVHAFVPQPHGTLPAPGATGNVLTSTGTAWSSSSPPSGTFDPSTLPLTYWRRGPFVVGISGAGYWFGQWTPAGPSFREAFRTGSTTIGASLNGIAGIKYASSGASRTTTVALESIAGGTAHVSDFLTASQFTFMGVVNFISTSAPGAQPYDDPKIWASDSGQMGFMFSTNGLGYFTYDGAAFPRVDRAISAGWHFFCIRYGGPVGAGNVQIDIDSSAGTPTAIGNMGFTLASYPMGTGYNTFSGTNADNEFDALELAASKLSLTDSQRDSFKSYANSRYAQSF